MHTIFLSIFALFFLFFCAVVIFAAYSKKVAAKKAAAAKKNMIYPSRRQLSAWEDTVFFFVAEGYEECCVDLFEEELEERGYHWESLPEDDSSLIEKLGFILGVSDFGYIQSEEWSKELFQVLRPEVLKVLKDVEMLLPVLPERVGNVRLVQARAWGGFIEKREKNIPNNHKKTLLSFLETVFAQLEGVEAEDVQQVEALDRLLRVA